MLSEAILTGKPVGLVPIEQDDKGRRQLGDAPQERRARCPPPRPSALLGLSAGEGLIGTVDCRSPQRSKTRSRRQRAPSASLLGDVG